MNTTRRSTGLSSTRSQQGVDLSKLDIETLKKYKRYHRLRVPNNPTKKELMEVIAVHFATQEIDEEAIIASFLQGIQAEKGRTRRTMHRTRRF